MSRCKIGDNWNSAYNILRNMALSQLELNVHVSFPHGVFHLRLMFKTISSENPHFWWQFVTVIYIYICVCVCVCVYFWVCVCVWCIRMLFLWQNVQCISAGHWWNFSVLCILHLCLIAHCDCFIPHSWRTEAFKLPKLHCTVFASTGTNWLLNLKNTK